MTEVDVIQGRLGWESGDISEADPENLSPHPKNQEIYGDTDDAGDLDEMFLESIAEKGVLEPLVVTNGKQIVSGHRRWLAAKSAGLDSVPVRYTEFDDELAEREALVEFNRQREKTPGQIVNEFEEMLEIEQERAEKERKRKISETQKNKSFETKEEFPTSQRNDKQAREKAAEKVNADVSGRTLEKGKKVKDKAEEGDETAQEEWQKLQSGEQSFNGAYEAIKSDGGTDVKQSDGTEDSSDIDVFTSSQTDEWSSPREIVEPLDEAVDGFDLDPCSGAEQSPFAAETYTEEDDGLAQSWHGTVWVNPPYSEMWDWTDKAIQEVNTAEANAVYYLCKGDSSTDWWQAAAQNATAICAIDHRLSFGDGENSAPFASHIIVFGHCQPDALDQLDEFGAVLRLAEVSA